MAGTASADGSSTPTFASQAPPTCYCCTEPRCRLPPIFSCRLPSCRSAELRSNKSAIHAVHSCPPYAAQCSTRCCLLAARMALTSRPPALTGTAALLAGRLVEPCDHLVLPLLPVLPDAGDLVVRHVDPLALQQWESGGCASAAPAAGRRPGQGWRLAGARRPAPIARALLLQVHRLGAASARAASGKAASGCMVARGALPAPPPLRRRLRGCLGTPAAGQGLGGVHLQARAGERRPPPAPYDAKGCPCKRPVQGRAPGLHRRPRAASATTQECRVWGASLQALQTPQHAPNACKPQGRRPARATRCSLPLLRRLCRCLLHPLLGAAAQCSCRACFQTHSSRL